MKYQIAVGDNKYDVEVGAIRDGVALVSVNAMSYEVKIDNFEEVTAGGTCAVQAPPPPVAVAAPCAAAPPPSPAPSVSAAPTVAGRCLVAAPMPGLIIEVNVKVGDTVQVGQTVVKMEAMKMLNNIKTQKQGTVREVRVTAGSEVSTGDVLLEIE